MAGQYQGNVCAYIKGPKDSKAKYLKIGVWFEDESGRISAVIDSVPLPHTAWTGWINLFRNDEGGAPRSSNFAGDEDDIPF